MNKNSSVDNIVASTSNITTDTETIDDGMIVLFTSPDCCTETRRLRSILHTAGCPYREQMVTIEQNEMLLNEFGMDGALPGILMDQTWIPYNCTTLLEMAREYVANKVLNAFITDTFSVSIVSMMTPTSTTYPQSTGGAGGGGFDGDSSSSRRMVQYANEPHEYHCNSNIRSCSKKTITSEATTTNSAPSFYHDYSSTPERRGSVVPESLYGNKDMFLRKISNIYKNNTTGSNEENDVKHDEQKNDTKKGIDCILDHFYDTIQEKQVSTSKLYEDLINTSTCISNNNNNNNIHHALENSESSMILFGQQLSSSMLNASSSLEMMNHNSSTPSHTSTPTATTSLAATASSSVFDSSYYEYCRQQQSKNRNDRNSSTNNRSWRSQTKKNKKTTTTTTTTKKNCYGTDTSPMMVSTTASSTTTSSQTSSSPSTTTTKHNLHIDYDDNTSAITKKSSNVGENEKNPSLRSFFVGNSSHHNDSSSHQPKVHQNNNNNNTKEATSSNIATAVAVVPSNATNNSINNSSTGSKTMIIMPNSNGTEMYTVNEMIRILLQCIKHKSTIRRNHSTTTTTTNKTVTSTYCYSFTGNDGIDCWKQRFPQTIVSDVDAIEFGYQLLHVGVLCFQQQHQHSMNNNNNNNNSNNNQNCTTNFRMLKLVLQPFYAPHILNQYMIWDQHHNSNSNNNTSNTDLTATKNDEQVIDDDDNNMSVNCSTTTILDLVVRLSMLLDRVYTVENEQILDNNPDEYINGLHSDPTFALFEEAVGQLQVLSLPEIPAPVVGETNNGYRCSCYQQTIIMFYINLFNVMVRHAMILVGTEIRNLNRMWSWPTTLHEFSNGLFTTIGYNIGGIYYTIAHIEAILFSGGTNGVIIPSSSSSSSCSLVQPPLLSVHPSTIRNHSHTTATTHDSFCEPQIPKRKWWQKLVPASWIGGGCYGCSSNDAVILDTFTATSPASASTKTTTIKLQKRLQQQQQQQSSVSRSNYYDSLGYRRSSNNEMRSSLLLPIEQYYKTKVFADNGTITIDPRILLLVTWGTKSSPSVQTIFYCRCFHNSNTINHDDTNNNNNNSRHNCSDCDNNDCSFCNDYYERVFQSAAETYCQSCIVIDTNEDVIVVPTYLSWFRYDLVNSGTGTGGGSGSGEYYNATSITTATTTTCTTAETVLLQFMERYLSTIQKEQIHTLLYENGFLDVIFDTEYNWLRSISTLPKPILPMVSTSPPPTTHHNLLFSSSRHLHADDDTGITTIISAFSDTCPPSITSAAQEHERLYHGPSTTKNTISKRRVQRIQKQESIVFQPQSQDLYNINYHRPVNTHHHGFLFGPNDKDGGGNTVGKVHRQGLLRRGTNRTSPQQPQQQQQQNKHQSVKRVSSSSPFSSHQRYRYEQENDDNSTGSRDRTCPRRSASYGGESTVVGGLYFNQINNKDRAATSTTETVLYRQVSDGESQITSLPKRSYLNGGYHSNKKDDNDDDDELDHHDDYNHFFTMNDIWNSDGTKTTTKASAQTAIAAATTTTTTTTPRSSTTAATCSYNDYYTSQDYDDEHDFSVTDLSEVTYGSEFYYCHQQES